MAITSSCESTQSPASSPHVLVVGSVNQDLTSNTKTLPTLGETVMGNTFSTACGGKGANQAVAAASLGFCPVSMICRVGDDVFGKKLLENFNRVGVQYDACVTTLSNTSSGVASIVVDEKSGDNMIIVSPGANYELTKDQVRAEVKAKKPTIVVAQLEIRPEVVLETFKAAKEINAITILNPAPAPNDPKTLDEFYQYTDIIIPNETELQKLCGKQCGTDDNEEAMARTLLERGVNKAVIVTLGARGAMIVEKVQSDKGESKIAMEIVDAPSDLPARSLPVKDTIGAGDAFCGALASYLSLSSEKSSSSSSSSLSLKQAAICACGVASTSIRKPGAQTSYPTFDELPDCLIVPEMSSIDRSSKRLKTSKPTLTFVTGNKKKLQEVQQILGEGTELPFTITNEKIDLPELQGDPLEIAAEKCQLAAKEINGAVLVEDTSLCFNALNGMPGPYIKWFLEKCGHDGLNKMLVGFDDKTAYAQTVVAFCKGPGEKVHVFDGRTNGKIVSARGPLDFGWDPIFEPNEGQGKTYAEMTKEFKNSISHRGRSFEKLRKFLKEYKE